MQIKVLIELVEDLEYVRQREAVILSLTVVITMQELYSLVQAALVAQVVKELLAPVVEEEVAVVMLDLPILVVV